MLNTYWIFPDKNVYWDKISYYNNIMQEVNNIDYPILCENDDFAYTLKRENSNGIKIPEDI